MHPAIKTGAVVGTGAAINVELGFIPVAVSLYAGDASTVTTAFLAWTLPFTSGGPTQVLPGATIRGLISKATATVRDVQLASGTWAAPSNAAGVFILEEGSLVGTFQSENIVVTNLPTNVVGTDDATVTVNVTLSIGAGASTQAVVTGNAAISRYEGAAGSNARGFTIGSTIAPSGVLLRYVAMREDI